MVVLDTCSLIEACKNKPDFSTKTIKLVEQGAYLLSISFAEIACKVKLGKLEMNTSIRNLFDEISQIDSIEIVNISVENWLDAIALQWPENKDLADRLITAYAIKKQLAIVTNDLNIKAFYKKVIW